MITPQDGQEVQFWNVGDEKNSKLPTLYTGTARYHAATDTWTWETMSSAGDHDAGTWPSGRWRQLRQLYLFPQVPCPGSSGWYTDAGRAHAALEALLISYVAGIEGVLHKAQARLAQVRETLRDLPEGRIQHTPLPPCGES